MYIKLTIILVSICLGKCVKLFSVSTFNRIHCLYYFMVSCGVWWNAARWPSWPWSYGSWIYNYLCSQCLSPLMLWVWISIRARCTTLCDKVCHWLVTGQWFSPDPPVSSSNKTYCYDITEILLKVVLNTIKKININILF